MNLFSRTCGACSPSDTRAVSSVFLGTAARILLALFFMAAALPKIKAPPEFALAVFRYQILPYGLVNVAAIFLPWIELVSGLALLTLPKVRRSALLIILGLLILFTLAKGMALARGLNISCGCFTVSTETAPIAYQDMALNLGLILLGFLAWRDRCRASGEFPEAVRGG